MDDMFCWNRIFLGNVSMRCLLCQRFHTTCEACVNLDCVMTHFPLTLSVATSWDNSFVSSPYPEVLGTRTLLKWRFCPFYLWLVTITIALPDTTVIVSANAYLGTEVLCWCSYFRSHVADP